MSCGAPRLPVRQRTRPLRDSARPTPEPSRSRIPPNAGAVRPSQSRPRKRPARLVKSYRQKSSFAVVMPGWSDRDQAARRARAALLHETNCRLIDQPCSELPPFSRLVRDGSVSPPGRPARTIGAFRLEPVRRRGKGWKLPLETRCKTPRGRAPQLVAMIVNDPKPRATVRLDPLISIFDNLRELCGKGAHEAK